MDLVLLFPGQGSQKRGMAQDLVATFPAARDVFERGDEALGVSISDLAFAGPDEELTLTHNAQPALFLHGAAVWAAIAAAAAGRVRAAAGHSLGEFTAYYSAGSLELSRGVRLVRRRGELMYETGRAQAGAMAAILGDLSGGVEALCAQATAEAGEVVPANYNSPGQVVVSGTVPGVERAMELAKEQGARRTMRLNVSGAFHSPLMAPAADGLAGALTAAVLTDPAFPVYSNVTGQAITAASAAERLLHQQLTAPVRWTELVERLAADYPDALYLEMGPGNVLAGLVRRISPAVRTQACGTAAEVEALLQLLS